MPLRLELRQSKRTTRPPAQEAGGRPIHMVLGYESQELFTQRGSGAIKSAVFHASAEV